MKETTTDYRFKTQQPMSDFNNGIHTEALHNEVPFSLSDKVTLVILEPDKFTASIVIFEENLVKAKINERR